MRMIPLLTTTPSRIRKPVIVLAFIRLLPVMKSPSSEPMAASGMVNSSTKGVDTDPNTDANIINISISDANIRKLNSLNDSSVRTVSMAMPLGISYPAISWSISSR